MEPDRNPLAEGPGRPNSDTRKLCVSGSDGFHLIRRRAIEGADYVVTMFQVGGYEPSTVVDFDIPERYGLQQTIADTIGVGGIMRGLRTVPVLVDVSNEVSEVAGDAILLNYTNPMAINMWGLA